MLLLMPACEDFSATERAHKGHLGVKVVSVYPGNAARGRPSVASTYLLMDGATGEPLAAAASALAASYLAREEVSRLVMVGVGALAPYLIAAHASVRQITEVMVWNRNPARAEELAASLGQCPYSVRAVRDLEQVVRVAGIVSCATLSNEPLVRGAWLSQAGTWTVSAPLRQECVRATTGPSDAPDFMSIRAKVL